MANAGYVRDGLIARGMPGYVADAFVANFRDESGLKSGITETAPNVHGTRGFGLYQLTDTSPGVGRRTNYERFAGQRGVDPSDVDTQLDFLMTELAGPEKKAARSIFGAKDTAEAAQAIVTNFLRPAEKHRRSRVAKYANLSNAAPGSFRAAQEETGAPSSMFSSSSTYGYGQGGPDLGVGRPGEIRVGPDGKTYQYAQTTGMRGYSGDQGWIRVNEDQLFSGQNGNVMASSYGSLGGLGGMGGTAPFAPPERKERTKKEMFGDVLGAIGAGLLANDGSAVQDFLEGRKDAADDAYNLEYDRARDQYRFGIDRQDEQYARSQDEMRRQERLQDRDFLRQQEEARRQESRNAYRVALGAAGVSPDQIDALISEPAAANVVISAQERQREEQATTAQQNRSIEYLRANHPDIADAVSGGLPIGDAMNEAMRRSRGGAGGSDLRYGMSPIYGQDANGDIVIGQLGNDGSLVPSRTPEGFRPLAPGDVARDRAAGTAVGKGQGEATLNLGQALQDAEYSINLIDEMVDHPGRETATGLSSKIDPRNYIAGTDATDFNVRRQQVQGRTFLQAFESLKGGGQITEIEGQKAEQAIARLNTAQSEESYLDALKELRGILTLGMDRARERAGINTRQPSAEPAQSNSTPDPLGIR